MPKPVTKKSAPARPAAAAKATPASETKTKSEPEAAPEEVLDLDAQMDAAFADVEDEMQEGYANTSASGDRYSPPKGEYAFTLVNDDETGLCGRVFPKQPGQNDDPDNFTPYPVLVLNVEITGANDGEIIGTRFEWPFYLKPFTDSQGVKKIAQMGTVKKICELLIGSEIPDPKTACKQILETCGGQTLAVRVSYPTDRKTHEVSDFANYSVRGVVESA